MAKVRGGWETSKEVMSLTCCGMKSSSAFCTWTVHHSAKNCSIPQVENTWALDAKGLFFRAPSDPVTLPVSLRINFTTCEVKRQACPRYHRRASQRRDNPTPVTQQRPLSWEVPTWSNWRECEIVRLGNMTVLRLVMSCHQIPHRKSLTTTRRCISLENSNPNGSLWDKQGSPTVNLISKFTPVPSLLPWFPAWHKENLRETVVILKVVSWWSGIQTESNEYQRQIHDMIIIDSPNLTWHPQDKLTNCDSQDLHSQFLHVYITFFGKNPISSTTIPY